MIKPWEISVLVYDYLKKNGYNETSFCFNNECSSLKLSDPLPNIFSCVLENLLSNGDLESRLKSYDEAQERGQSEAEKLKELEKEMLHIRKRLKKRKRHSSERDSKIKHRKTTSTQENNNSRFSVSSPCIPPLNTSLYTTDTQLTTSGFENSLMQQTHHNSSVKLNPLMFPELSSVKSAEKSLGDEKNVSDNVLRTPEKRLSTSRRKAATPKKGVTSDIQGSFVQTLTDNINAKNEKAALDTLNSVEPWLEQFISSLSQNPDQSELTNEDLPQPRLCIDYNNNDSKNEEAALSLLALNQSAELVPTATPPAIKPSALVITSTATSNILPHQLNSSPVTSADSPSPAAVSITISDISFPQQSVALARIENRTVTTTSQASVPTAAESTARDHITGAFQQAASPLISDNTNPTHCASSSQPNTTDGNLSFDPILIRNQKTFSMAQRNPNMEIIVLPPIHTQYQHILPKPSQAPDPVPSSFHVSGDTVAPIYNFVKPSPQQEAQKFFGQLHRPYHQQLSQIDQLYLVDRSEKIVKVNAPQTSTETGTDLESKKIKDAVKVPDKPESQPNTSVDTSELESAAGSNSATIPKTTFVSWDQKIRKSIAETDFKTPPPPSGVKKKKKRRSKEKSVQISEVHSPRAGSDFLLDVGVPGGPIPVEVPTDKKRKKKRRKSKKDASEKLSSKSKKLCSKIKKKKKKREKEKESLKKPPITPEFVNESLSSEGEDSVISTPRFRHMSESDSVMAESLLKSFNNSSNLPKSPQNSSTPVTSKVAVSAALSVRQKIADTIMPSFIEENANSSFDIDEASRPKPVFVPEGSQNSCSCHSNHYKDNQKGKCPSTKTFSFKDQENIDSPKNYDENSNSITVSSLFPTISSSSVNMYPKAEITNRTLYRNQKEDEESENEQEEAASDDEVREKTTKLPPISSQDKDLLDSSDEEQHISATSDELGLFSAKDLSKSVALSESEVDSPLKKSPVKSPKLRLIPLMKKERYVPPLKPSDSRKKGVKSKDILVAAEHEVQDNGEELATELEEAEHLPSFIEMEDDINDSQELVIDGDEVAPQAGCHPDIRLTSRLESRTRLSISKGKDRHPKLLDKSVRKSGDLNRSAVENNRNKENSPSVIEDSCDTWYQNVENKMKLKSSFTCEICRKSFPSLAVLTVHSETCSKMYLICSNCGRKCSSKSGLTLHRKTCLNMLNSSKAKEKRKSSGENSKIKISPSNSKSGSQKKSLKKKKSKGYIDKDIDEFLGNLRYQ